MSRNQKLPKPDLTIVGGQPREERFDPGSEDTEVPVGFEMLLYRAARDPEFRQQLLTDRKAAADKWGIRLRPSEQATLEAVSDDALDHMIDRLASANPQRSKFMVNVAAAVTSLAAGTVSLGAVEGCGDETDGASVTTTTTPAGYGGVSAGIPPGGTGGTGGPWTTGGGGAGGGFGGGGGAAGGVTGGGGAGGSDGGSAGSGG